MSNDSPNTSNHSPSRKLIVLGIDAAEPQLLQSLVEEGALPNIAALMSEGLTGNSRGVEALYGGATWPSFYTAVNPGKHGIYWLDQLIPGTYRTRKATPSDFARRPSLWDALSAAGRRVVVLDVPLTRSTPGLRGTQVVEWGVHDAAFGFRTEPAQVATEILGSVGPHPAPAACDAPTRTLAEYRNFAEQLVRGAQTRAALTCSLLAKEPWDFAIQVFSEAHCAGHQLWHFHDANHPAYDADITAAEGDHVRKVYIAIDTAVGDIVRSAGKDVTIVLMALHGMSYMAGCAPLLDEILTRLGVKASPAPAGSPASAGSSAPSPSEKSIMRRVMRSAKRAWHHLPVGMRGPLYHARQYLGREVLGFGTALNIDPARSQCFKCEMGPAVSGIRLNLKGREPEGVLEPGTEAEHFSMTLMQQLHELTNPDTGQPIVHRVVRSRDLFHGDRVADLPDLIVEWSLDQAIGTSALSPKHALMKASSPRIGVVQYENRYCRSGEHRIGGMFVARGAGIPRGHLDRTVSTLDLAPTFARMLGCEMHDVDGVVIEELLRL